MAGLSTKQSLLDFYNSTVDFSTNTNRNQIFDVLRAYGADGPLVEKDLDGGMGHFFMFLGSDGG